MRSHPHYIVLYVFGEYTVTTYPCACVYTHAGIHKFEQVEFEPSTIDLVMI
jgi:hypothetical protein